MLGIKWMITLYCTYIFIYYTCTGTIEKTITFKRVKFIKNNISCLKIFPSQTEHDLFEVPIGGASNSCSKHA